jgi:hypothetical protein
LVGTDTDSEWVIRWLIALMVLCCDSLAIPDSRGFSTANDRVISREGIPAAERRSQALAFSVCPLERPNS